MPAHFFLQWQNVVSLAPSLRQSPTTRGARPRLPDHLGHLSRLVYRGFFSPTTLPLSADRTWVNCSTVTRTDDRNRGRSTLGWRWRPEGLEQRAEQVDGQREKGRGVALRSHLPHGLQITQLHRDGVARQDLGGL